MNFENTVTSPLQSKATSTPQSTRQDYPTRAVSHGSWWRSTEQETQAGEGGPRAWPVDAVHTTWLSKMLDRTLTGKLADFLVVTQTTVVTLTIVPVLLKKPEWKDLGVHSPVFTAKPGKGANVERSGGRSLEYWEPEATLMARATTLPFKHGLSCKLL